MYVILFQQLLWLLGRLVTFKPVQPHQLNDFCLRYQNKVLSRSEIVVKSKFLVAFFVFSLGFFIFFFYLFSVDLCHRTKSNFFRLSVERKIKEKEHNHLS